MNITPYGGKRIFWIFILVLSLAILLAVVGYAYFQSTSPLAVEPTTNPAHQPLTPTDIPGVKNFAQVSPILYRGAQPTKEGFVELKKRGIKTIVSLRTFNGDSDDIEGMGLGYVRFDCKAWHIEDEDMAAFLKVLMEPENQPVYVHCLHGSDRTGSAVAVYRMVEQGWTPEEAIAEINNFGYHPIFKNILEYLGKFDPERMKAEVAKTRMPKIEKP